MPLTGLGLDLQHFATAVTLPNEEAMVDALDVLGKLLLGTLAFVLIVWFGARDKRVGGALLTFPLLNGIAMLTGVDPVGIAGTIYPVAMWNSVFFLFVVHRCEWLPPLPVTLNTDAKIALRAGCWFLLWLPGAVLLAWLRDALSFAAWLFAIQLACAAWYIWRWWQPPPPASLPTFREMWLNGSGFIRLACFVLAFGLLSLVAYVETDSRWVGWASALPLPGLFALATLSATRNEPDIASLGDTVLLGPLLVIPFNWLLARAVIQLRIEQTGTFAEIATVVIFWVIAAGLVFGLLPPFAGWRDRLRAKE
jgi:hypothetical protein